MSIRFRLTLLYSAILTGTLIIFGFALYTIQSQDTLNSLKVDLAMSSGRVVDAALKTSPDHAPRDDVGQKPPPPQSFDEFSGEAAFQDLREREIVRIMDLQGNLIASPYGREEDSLPLSDEGFAALENQQEWWEEDVVNDELMLIYSRPVVLQGETVYIVQVARSLAERNRTLQSLASTLLGAGLVTILVAFAAGWGLSGVTLRPIHRMTQTAKRIGDERDFASRVDYSGPQDEVGRLATTFNHMLVSLQDAYQKLENSLQMQRDFVADVSHELRTPLTTLRGNLGLLNRTPPIPAGEKDEILQDMVEESERLIRLVNDLLRLARADAARSLNCQPLAIQPVLEETIRDARNLDAGRDIALAASSNLSIMGDRDAFKQVMLILVDNAIKHSEGKIDVFASQSGGTVEIRVQDHGRGISPEEIYQIFDRFHRGEVEANTAGFGLGLPIAKALVEGMNGEITVESELGQGSTVILSFPARD